MINSQHLMEWFSSSLKLINLMPLLKRTIPLRLDNSWKRYISYLCQKSVFFLIDSKAFFFSNMLEIAHDQKNYDLIETLIRNLSFNTDQLNYKTIDAEFFYNYKVDDAIKSATTENDYIRHSIKYFNATPSNQFKEYLITRFHLISDDTILELSKIKELRSLIIKYQPKHLKLINPEKDEVLYSLYMDDKSYEYVPDDYYNDIDVLVASGYQYPIGKNVHEFLIRMAMNHYLKIGNFENSELNILFPYINQNLSKFKQVTQHNTNRLYNVILQHKHVLELSDIKKILNFFEIVPIILINTLDKIHVLNECLATEIKNIIQTSEMLQQSTVDMISAISNYMNNDISDKIEFKNIEIE